MYVLGPCPSPFQPWLGPKAMGSRQELHPQMFQKPLTKEGSFKHIGILVMISRTFGRSGAAYAYLLLGPKEAKQNEGPQGSHESSQSRKQPGIVLGGSCAALKKAGTHSS